MIGVNILFILFYKLIIIFVNLCKLYISTIVYITNLMVVLLNLKKNMSKIFTLIISCKIWSFLLTPSLFHMDNYIFIEISLN